MATSFDATGSVNTSTASPATQSLTLTVGANPALVVAVRANGTTRVPTSATYGGVTGTILSSDNNATIQSAAILFLGIPTGTQTLSIQGSGGAETYVGSYALYSGVSQTGQPQATTNYLTNTTTQPNSQSLTPNSLGRVITATASADAAVLNSGATSRNNFAGSLIADSNADVTAAQTVSVSLGTRAHSVWLFTLSPVAATISSLPVLGS